MSLKCKKENCNCEYKESTHNKFTGYDSYVCDTCNHLIDKSELPKEHINTDIKYSDTPRKSKFQLNHCTDQYINNVINHDDLLDYCNLDAEDFGIINSYNECKNEI